ncbi:hypothetical protein [Rhizobium sp. Rhizsp42]|uniref:hypothetical protein n=1 Tax=Rhizobium sp. Rhizsp42 TaxID=3243034 RepID=UPI0039B09E6D
MRRKLVTVAVAALAPVVAMSSLIPIFHIAAVMRNWRDGKTRARTRMAPTTNCTPLARHWTAS